MAQIYIIKDPEAFMANPLFSQYAGQIKNSACLVLISAQGLENFAAAGIIEAVFFPPYSEEERAAFISDYTGLIASLNSCYKEQLLWWATDISSKNTYFCLLPECIQELLEIERAMGICKDKPLLVIAPSNSIYGALQKIIIKHGRKIFWPGAVVKGMQQRVTGAGANILRLFVRALRFYTRALWARVVLGQYARQWLNQKKEFYVIKTFSYPDSWDSNGDYADSFFGRLPRYLSKDNNVLVLSYHWQGYREFLKRIFLEKTLAIFPVEFFIKGSDVLRAVWRILTFRLTVAPEVYFRDLEVSDIIRFELAHTMNGIQVFQLLHYDATRNMLKTLHAGTFLFTFENNPWERMSMLACRHHSPSTKLIGCQHSVVPQAALNMFVHPLERDIVPLPDRVLTTGDTPKNILQHYGDYSLAPVRSACALRYEYLSDIKAGPRQKSQGRILLVLDGVEQTRLMLKYVLEQLGGNHYYQLRIRCHPALPWTALSKRHHIDAGKYPNVAISRGPLQEDLSWADMIIYWQTAVVLEAMSLGKPAINFKTDDILNYDPLFESDALKWTVTKQENLLDIIASIEGIDEKSYQLHLAQASAYVRRYFYPVTPKNLELFKGKTPLDS